LLIITIYSLLAVLLANLLLCFRVLPVTLGHPLVWSCSRRLSFPFFVVSLSALGTGFSTNLAKSAAVSVAVRSFCLRFGVAPVAVKVAA